MISSAGHPADRQPEAKGEMKMAICEICGNDYDKAFKVIPVGSEQAHVFDSFECAIQALAPTCARCGLRIVGHGVEADGAFYCCAHCAHEVGVTAVSDRA